MVIYNYIFIGLLLLLAITFAVLPLLSMDRAVDELKWAKDHGACGIFKKGYECGKTAGDSYFFPLYETASKLDIPICIHTGTDGPGEGVSPNAMSAACGFLPLVNSGVMEQFPNLRVGFVEAGASWIPFLLSVNAASVRRTHLQGLGNTTSLGEFNRLQFNQPRIFVACQTQDDLPYILQFGTEDNLINGARALQEALDSAGMKNTWWEGPGLHEWQVWRKHLHAFAPLLFR